MKLNLLPTTVNREGRAKSAWFFSILLAVAGVASMLYMKTTSERFVKEQNARIDKTRQRVNQGVELNANTEKVITDHRGLVMNSKLATAMLAHSDKYPDLYNKVKSHIPSYFRLTGMSATPNGEVTQVNLTGVIQTQQQYADLMLALLRIENVVTVGRAGFTFANALVPPLTEIDQTGRIQQPGDPTWPDDPLDRLDAQIANARVTGFQNQNGFGSTTEPMQRGAMPDWSTVTVSVVVRENLQSPNPIQAIRSTAGYWPQPDMTKALSTTGGSNTTPAPNTPNNAPNTPPTNTPGNSRE